LCVLSLCYLTLIGGGEEEFRWSFAEYGRVIRSFLARHLDPKLSWWYSVKSD
jgi:hypothetical protein